MHKQTVRDIDVKGKRILLRVDYNVPVQNGQVGDTLRIEASFDTIHYLLRQGSSIVLISHLGEPKGTPDPQYSLRPVAAKAAELLGQPIPFISDCIGPEAEAAAKALQPGQLVMLENVRFHHGELDNNAVFARQLASLGEVYVNDAFAVEHRTQASVVGVTQYLPAVAGLLVEREVDTITQALDNPTKPFVAVIGGAKVSSKIEVLENLLHKVDALFIGGAMANTFLAAQGQTMGRSLYEPGLEKAAEQIIAQAKELNVQIVVPSDLIISASLDKAEDLRTVPPHEVEPEDYIVDLGAKFAQDLAVALAHGGTVIWNGPVGKFEIPEFAAGSQAVAEAIIASGSRSIIGGGDTAAFVDAAGLHDKFSWVSTGGGASLELMAGKALPGIEALRDRT